MLVVIWLPKMIQNERSDGGGEDGLFRLITSQNADYAFELEGIGLVANDRSTSLMDYLSTNFGAGFTPRKPCREKVTPPAQRLLHILLTDH